MRAAVERKTRCQLFPSLIPGSGTCGPNNIEHNWMCELPSVVPGLQMWRQLTYPSILPWHPPSSADIFQNPPVPSPLPSHASPGCPLCLCCAVDSLVIFSLGTGNVKFFGSYWKTMIKSMKFGQDRRGLGRTIIQRLSRNKVRVFV